MTSTSVSPMASAAIYKSRVAAAPRRASLDSTADCFRLWLLMLPVPMICRDGFH